MQNREPDALYHGAWRVQWANEAAMTPRRQIISGVLLAVIGGGYALYLALTWKEEKNCMDAEK